MFVGLTMTSQGNYKCLFCNHKVWKQSEKMAIAHVEDKHPKERAKLLAEKLIEAQSKPPRIEYKEKIVYKDRPEPDYQDKRIDIYCSTCRIVMQSVRLPLHHTIDTTSCSNCGNTSLMMVSKIT